MDSTTEKVFLSGYTKWLKAGTERKMKQSIIGGAYQCTRVLSVGEGMAFYNQRFQGDPARDERPCPKKGTENTHIMQYERQITFFFFFV